MNTRIAPVNPIAAGVLAAALYGSPAALAQTPPERLVDGLENLLPGGKPSGFRRSGAKGVCAAGEFVGNAEGQKLSVAPVFNGAAIPVIARFAITGPNPNAPDKAKAPRGLALDFQLPGGERFQMANLSTPVFTASTPETFAGFLESRRPDPATRMPDPAKVKAFNDANPEVLIQAKYLASQPVPAGYANLKYWGVHSFGFVDAKGGKRFGKWIFEPVDGVKGLSDEELKAKPDAFAFDELRKRVAAGPVEFDFKVQLAEPGDVINSATVELPAQRPTVSVGKLRITRVEPGPGGACDAITFNPTVLPKGIEMSDDPMLVMRASTYALSLGRRLSEAAK